MFFNNNEYKPNMLPKWDKKMPTAKRLMALWQTMSDNDKAQVGELSAKNHWLDTYFGETATEIDAYNAYFELWDYQGDQKIYFLKQLMEQVKTGSQNQSTAVKLLQELQEDAVVSPLILALLQNKAYDVQAVSAVLSSFHQKAGEVLAEVYSQVATAEKITVLSSLALLKGETALVVLKKAKKEESPILRGKAAETYGNIAPENLLVELKPLLEDPEVAVRVAAAEAVGKNLNQEGLQILTSMLENDEEWLVKSMCSSFLTKWQAQLADKIAEDDAKNWNKDLPETTE